MRWAIVGTGGIGGLYGGRLIAGGEDVTFVARSGASVLAHHGLKLKSVDGDLTLPAGSFNVATDPTHVGPVDVAVVAVKTTSNAQLPALLGPLVGPDTTVLVMQNGLGVEAVADAAAPGAAAVLGAMCFVCCMRDGPGEIRHVDYGLVTIGVHRGAPAQLDDITGTMSAAAIEVKAVEDLNRERWRKLLWNIPFNGLSVVLRTGTDGLLADPDGRALVERVMSDVVAGANACGADLTADDAAGMITTTEKMVPYRTSMALDFDARQPMEYEAIHRQPSLAAASAGRPMPTVELLCHQLAAIDRANRS